MKCYLCGDELTDENSSKEHIIPNALGGKLTAKILCKKCNSDLKILLFIVECENFLKMSNM